MTDITWHDFLTTTAAQFTAVTAIALALTWWAPRVVRWFRKARTWRRALQKEHDAQRIGQYAAATIEPRFEKIEADMAELHRKIDNTLLEAVRRRVREDDLYTRLEEHMLTEEQAAAKPNDPPAPSAPH